MIFSNPEEVEIAMRNGYVHLHTRIGIATQSMNKPWTEFQKGKILITTVGKVMFNSIMPEGNEISPEGMPYLNENTLQCGY